MYLINSVFQLLPIRLSPFDGENYLDIILENVPDMVRILKNITPSGFNNPIYNFL